MSIALVQRLQTAQFVLIDRTRRPSGMLESTRWLFGGLAILSLVLVLPATTSSGRWLLAVAGMAAVVVTTLTVYACRRVPIALDVVDAVALAVMALIGPTPSVVFAFLFPLLWFRSLYGSTRRAFTRAALYASVLLGCVGAWPYVFGHAGGTELGPLINTVPTMFLTVVVGRHLVNVSEAREQSAKRDAAHVRLGSDLLGVTDAAAIRDAAWVAISTICNTTPGLRVLKVVVEDDSVRTCGATQGFVALPPLLSAAVLTVAGGRSGSARDRAKGTAELNALVDVPCAWASVMLAATYDQPAGSLLLGSPGRLPPAEAVVSIHSLVNQVALALRTSEAHQELTVQATLDGLTGLANRASFNAATAAALGDASLGETAVLFVDLDDFKDVNDMLGHAAGDQLLREVAARLRRATRPTDLCARLGGDEFAVLLAGTGDVVATEIARRVVQAVATPAQLVAGVAHVGASVGVATATSDTHLDELMHRADVAMYAAKAQGKGRTQVFEPGLLRVDSGQLAFERELASAASRGELVVHYQPILSLAGNACCAVEALVRWQHPTRGLVYPSEFIEIAERTGAIGEIGAYVLGRACTDAARWRDAYPDSPLAIHVNVSALQLDDDSFIDRVTTCLAEGAIPPSQLVLEITETVTMSSAVTVDRLNALAAIGVTIAIDDFGTGYSALTTLRTLPVRIVKIDKSFVAGSTLNPDDRAVTEAVVKMATQMGMRTVAEGVERPDQATFLQSIGADFVQGFLYLRPSSAEDFGAWLDANRAALAPDRVSAVVVPFVPRRTG